MFEQRFFLLRAAFVNIFPLDKLIRAMMHVENNSFLTNDARATRLKRLEQ